MINRLRRSFITAAMLSLLLVFLVIVGAINLLNYHDMTAAADEVLVMLAENGGVFPAWKSQKLQALLEKSPEALFTCRYFSVRMADETTVLSANTEKISAVDETGAAEYARAVWERETGFYQNFRFLRWDAGSETLFIFLDRGKEIESFHSLLFSSILVALFGLLSVFVLLLILSKRMVRPVSESYEKQRRFITDANHEIKTPLTIISADADVLDMEYGGNEWLRDIQLQVKRLTELTNDLIYLSKMEEHQKQLQVQEFSLSGLADELVRSFQALAKTQEKSFTSSIQPGLILRGDEKMIGQAVSNLLDNALKYSDPGGDISLTLEKRGRSVYLNVYNTTQEITEESLKNLFDRFYRADPSRNSQTGGHGIGLSIVQAVVSAHKGEVNASSQDGRSLTISIILPTG